MIRWGPFNEPPGTPWRNGNPATGTRGSIIDARAVDHSQAEIVNAITRLGLTPDRDNLEQLGIAIQNAIAAATGGGDTSGFVTVETARARLPIFPEVLTADGRLTITSPSSGTLLVNPAGTIRHRGVHDVVVSDIDEVDRTFAMLPSKVAHVRWSPSNGFDRLYLDDPVYNPLGLPETDPSFDTAYDSALLARATTDTSANVTITTLANLHQSEFLEGTGRVTDGIAYSSAQTAYGSFAAVRAGNTFVYNSARKPRLHAIHAVLGAGSPGVRGLDGVANAIHNKSVSRYGTTFDLATDFADGSSNFYAEIDFQAIW